MRRRPLHELHRELVAHCEATGRRDLADELSQRTKLGRPKDGDRVSFLFAQRKRMLEHLRDGGDEEAILRAWTRLGGTVNTWRAVLHIRRPDMRARRHEFE